MILNSYHQILRIHIAFSEYETNPQEKCLEYWGGEDGLLCFPGKYEGSVGKEIRKIAELFQSIDFTQHDFDFQRAKRVFTLLRKNCKVRGRLLVNRREPTENREAFDFLFAVINEKEASARYPTKEEFFVEIRNPSSKLIEWIEKWPTVVLRHLSDRDFNDRYAPAAAPTIDPELIRNIYEKCLNRLIADSYKSEGYFEGILNKEMQQRILVKHLKLTSNPGIIVYYRYHMIDNEVKRRAILEYFETLPDNWIDFDFSPILESFIRCFNRQEDLWSLFKALLRISPLKTLYLFKLFKLSPDFMDAHAEELAELYRKIATYSTGYLWVKEPVSMRDNLERLVYKMDPIYGLADLDAALKGVDILKNRKECYEYSMTMISKLKSTIEEINLDSLEECPIEWIDRQLTLFDNSAVHTRILDPNLKIRHYILIQILKEKCKEKYPEEYAKVEQSLY